MGFLKALESLSWGNILPYVLNLLVALPCITLHEMAHGWAAYKLGDSTAKDLGRLSLNPLRHLDPLGLILMITVGFGWAKPVPIDMRRFREPKKGMALSSLAGPLSNILLSIMALAIAGLIYRSGSVLNYGAGKWAFIVLVYIAIRSTFLGLFNLIPIPPLDGSRLLTAVLPDDIYYRLMRFERYLILIVFALCFFGPLADIVYKAGGWVLDKLCVITFFPRGLMSELI
ncbi:MAG: site-2 protease family protein [Oscillospiraceae bacterium]